MVSLPQKQFVAILLGVCMHSAGIGTGVALLAEAGPAGPAGGITSDLCEELESLC